MAAHFASTEAKASAATAGLVFSWNGTDLYDKIAPIIAAAGPEEPYRSRFVASQESGEKGRETRVDSRGPAEKSRESREKGQADGIILVPQP